MVHNVPHTESLWWSRVKTDGWWCCTWKLVHLFSLVSYALFDFHSLIPPLHCVPSFPNPELVSNNISSSCCHHLCAMKSKVRPSFPSPSSPSLPSLTAAPVPTGFCPATAAATTTASSTSSTTTTTSAAAASSRSAASPLYVLPSWVPDPAGDLQRHYTHRRNWSWTWSDGGTVTCGSLIH